MPGSGRPSHRRQAAYDEEDSALSLLANGEAVDGVAVIDSEGELVHLWPGSLLGDAEFMRLLDRFGRITSAPDLEYCVCKAKSASHKLVLVGVNGRAVVFKIGEEEDGEEFALRVLRTMRVIKRMVEGEQP